MTTTCYLCALNSFHLINNTYKFTQLNVNSMFVKSHRKKEEREKKNAHTKLVWNVVSESTTLCVCPYVRCPKAIAHTHIYRNEKKKLKSSMQLSSVATTLNSSTYIYCIVKKNISMNF